MSELLEKMKKTLFRILICIVWIGLVGAFLGEVFDIFPIYKLGFVGSFIKSIITLITYFLPIIIMVLVKGSKTKCPSCKKMFAMKANRTELVSRKPKYVKVINNTYSTYTGEITHESEQRILGTEKTLRTQYICKYCNAEKYKTFCESTTEPWRE